MEDTIMMKTMETMILNSTAPPSLVVSETTAVVVAVLVRNINIGPNSPIGLQLLQDPLQLVVAPVRLAMTMSRRNLCRPWRRSERRLDRNASSANA